MLMVARTWFVTGSSRGLGRHWTEAALAHGDRVAATARDVATVADLVERYGDAVLPLALDVTDRDAVFAAVDRAAEHFGRLDVVVNNAGYGLFGMVEEVSEPEARAQIETNLFGALWVTQAVLPHLRGQRGGHLLQVSSIAGVSAFPNLGVYHASKWALEGLSQALAAEVAAFGVKVTLVEPGPYATDWRGSSAVRAQPMPAYDGVRAAAAAARAGRVRAPGDPAATSAVIRQLVEMTDPPLRLLLGDGPLGTVTADYESRLATWREWADLSAEAQGESG
jgi:NAD(P)-dependent dehydrogenase (short-subunit alcohol dehydrogenase family)